MTIRDQLDQIARLEGYARLRELPMREWGPDERDYAYAVMNFWRSGGRDLAIKGLQAEAMREAIGRAVKDIKAIEDYAEDTKFLRDIRADLEKVLE